MKLQFVEIRKSHGKESSKVLFTWSDVPISRVPAVCENFMQGFIYAMCFAKHEVRYPACMIHDGWSAQSWRYHDSDSGYRWEFRDGRNHLILFSRRYNKQ